MMKVIDLFSGVGGMSLGFKQAGFNIVFANEYNESIASSYQKNHQETIVNTTSISDLDLNDIFSQYQGEVDVVIGGPPCQGFSQKGNRVGLKDERNFMFIKFFEVVSIVKPKYFLLENVPNILSSENGFFRKEIIELFSKIGYKITSNVLKAEKFGIPQIRRRAFFLGVNSDKSIELPVTNGKTTLIKDCFDDLPSIESGGGESVMDYASNPRSAYQKYVRGSSKIVRNHIATRHSKIVLERLKMISLNGSKKDLPEHHQTKSIHSGTWSRLKPEGFATTITTRFDTPSSGQFTLPFQDRCLTVREAARVQSFPDDFIFYGTKTSQMLQVGNAVPPLLAFEIAKKIKDHHDIR